MARPKKSAEELIDSKVIRVPNKHYKKIKKLMTGKRMSEFFDYIMPLLDLDVCYLVEGQIFTDIKEARGEVIVRKAKTNQDTKIKFIIMVGEE